MRELETGFKISLPHEEVSGQGLLWSLVRSRSDLPLRPYQRTALEHILDAYLDGRQSVAISLPTGCGKTIVFLALARGVVEAGGRVLIVAHRDELILQPIEKLSLVWPGAPEPGVIKAERFEPGRPIVLASIQTLWRRLDRLVQGFDLVVIDEAHHAAASTYRMALDRLLELKPAMKVLGVSATLFRRDGESLREIFKEVVFEYSVLEAIADGYLCGIDYRAVKTGCDLSGVRFDYRAGDFAVNQLAQTVNTPERNTFAVETWLELAEGRKTIAFCVDIKHAHDLAETFRAYGVEAQTVTGQTPLEERRAMLKAFARGEIPVITNCQVLTEGFDDPAVDCLLLARPTASKALYIQMVGRGLRLYPGKKNCLVIDLVDNSSRHSLVSIADLDSKLKRRIELEEAVGRGSRENVQLDLSLASQILGVEERQVFDPSAFYWARGEYGWAASLGDGRTLYIRQTKKTKREELFVPYLIEREGIRPLTSRPVDIELAFGVANGVLRDQGAAALYKPDASWRNYPPTEKQIEFCERWGLPRPRTKGEASDLITLAIAEWAFKKNIRSASHGPLA
ncbi:DEAD/DEAH box helicase [Thermosulfurimonas dismutans]|uniref:Putative helicase n=1 Tax=Thermosulfurimonas dismutans TaxID=999894 RepID=A0A179D2N6_9BACT|nr:DEAD/DEAH box helicase [Thermosulfurimonas dismutans]OAQ20344.1 putative helicase [Thermosulfurimonas dismutans]